MFSLISLAAVLGTLATQTQGYFILSHKILETTRFDPVITPGQVSPHLHTIAGGSSFSSDVEYATMQTSACTTAPVSVDKSNYWTPQLFYWNPTEETYTMIPVINMNTYYLPRPAYTGEPITAMPNGLRMISGNPFKRESTNDVESKAITFVCLDAQGNDGQQNYLFNHTCGSMRAQVNFRSCWNGVDLDTDDHMSHMAWPSGGVDGGSCPSSHPVHLPMLFYEVIYNTGAFPFNAAGTPSWIFANGDPTGYGMHGDFVSGWGGEYNGTSVLQAAINDCNADNGVGGVLTACPPFVPFLDSNSANACQPEHATVDEDIGDGHGIKSLPGGVVVTWSTADALSAYEAVLSGNATTASLKNTTSAIPAGYSYVGCVAEGPSGRALTGPTLTASNMTRGVCVAFCQSKGFAMAGVEYADECYCGNALTNGATNTTLGASQCGMACAGLSTENCGGSRTLSLYSNPSVVIATAASSQSTLTPGYSLVGCYQELTNARLLSSASWVSSTMTRGGCTSYCSGKGYAFAGTEYADECYCGNSLPNTAVVLDASKCSMTCANSSVTETCGGSGSLNVFHNPALDPVMETLPAGWTYDGCRVDSGTRALNGYTYAASGMTQNICISKCASKGYVLAGIEYASECYCGNAYVGGALADESTCSMSCSGNKGSMCGGSNRLSTFKYSNASATTTTASSSNVTTSNSTAAATAIITASSSTTVKATTSALNMTTSSSTMIKPTTPSSIATTVSSIFTTSIKSASSATTSAITSPSSLDATTVISTIGSSTKSVSSTSSTGSVSSVSKAASSTSTFTMVSSTAASATSISMRAAKRRVIQF